MKARIRRRRFAAFFVVSWLMAAAAPGQASGEPFIKTVDTGGLEARSAALILSGQEGGDLPLSLVVLNGPTVEESTPGASSSQRTSSVDFLLTAAGPDLVADWPEGDDLLVEVYAYALDADDQVAAYTSQAFHVVRDDYFEALEKGQSLHFGSRLDLLPGDYSLRLLVLLRQSGRLGLRLKTITAGSASRAPTSADAGPGVAHFLTPMKGPLALAEPRVEAKPGVIVSDEGMLVPVEWPDLTQLTQLYFNGTAGDAFGDAATVEVRIHDQNGHVLRRVTAIPRPVTTVGSPGEWARLSLEPWDLDPGQYLLSLHRVDSTPADDGTGQELGDSETTPRASWTPVRVASRLSTGAGLDPAAFGSPDGVSTDRPPAPDSPKIANRRQLVSVYRAALTLLAQGEPEAAEAAVMDLERQAMGDGRGSLQGELLGSQVLVARTLVQDELELLVPLMVLHEGLYRRYRSRQQFLLATHSRKLVAQMVEIIEEGSPNPALERLCGQIFTSQAGYLLQLGSALAARNALDAALARDADEPTALHLQGTIAEALGDYVGAVQYFRRLQALGELNAEGRLRLAINLRRVDKKPKDVASLLAELVESDAEEWIVVLAYQEFASSRIATGDETAALDLLVAGRKRFPNQPKLTIQQAALLDGAGRSRAARELLYSLEEISVSDRQTPRLRYSEWPLEQLTGLRQTLERRQNELLPALGQSLAPGPAGGDRR